MQYHCPRQPFGTARRLTPSQPHFVLNTFFTLAPTRTGTFNSCSHTLITFQPVFRN